MAYGGKREMTGAVRTRTRKRLAGATDASDTNRAVVPDADSADIADDDLDAAVVADAPDDLDTARLRQVLNMLLEGRTQKEIAANFGKNVRTIRRWIIEAKRRKLALTEGLTPQQALADFLYCCAAQMADLLRMKSAAEAQGDFGVAVRCSGSSCAMRRPAWPYSKGSDFSTTWPSVNRSPMVRETPTCWLKRQRTF